MRFVVTPWTIHGSSSIIRDRWIDLRADNCTTASGISVDPYYVLRYPDWAHVVCIDHEQRICVVWQYRHGVGRTMAELPGGIVERGEDPLIAAKRELREETGIVGEEWRACGSFCTNPANQTNSIYVFACRVRSIDAKREDAAEFSMIFSPSIN
jgi:8-oxo-dGTP pyrophosphatase MutT (NUDIX family)